MKPGRELDALIAEKVMGWTEIGDDHDAADFLDKHPYSTDIAAAWEVVEHVKKLPYVHGMTVSSFTSGVCIAGLTYSLNREVYVRDKNREHQSACEGETAPHAICLAALKAVENEKC